MKHLYCMRPQVDEDDNITALLRKSTSSIATQRYADSTSQNTTSICISSPDGMRGVLILFNPPRVISGGNSQPLFLTISVFIANSNRQGGCTVLTDPSVPLMRPVRHQRGLIYSTPLESSRVPTKLVLVANDLPLQERAGRKPSVRLESRILKTSQYF